MEIQSRGIELTSLHARGRLIIPGTDIEREIAGTRVSECSTYKAKLANVVMISAGRYIVLASVIVVVQAVISCTSFHEKLEVCSNLGSSDCHGEGSDRHSKCTTMSMDPEDAAAPKPDSSMVRGC